MVRIPYYSSYSFLLVQYSFRGFNNVRLYLKVDYRPKSEAFWLVGGFDRNLIERKKIAGLKGAAVANFFVKEDDPVEK